MHQTGSHSWTSKKNKLAKGCELCITGEKTVLFVTGVCGKKCFYCPVSEQKIGKDVIFANETPGTDVNDIIKEAELCDSKGVGITGGDPLARINRTCEFIKKLKEHFGKDFHTHLYTPLLLVSKENLKKLHDAGLDEIRFHPDLDSDEKWKRIELAKDFDWDIGVEIPVIPGKEEITKRLIHYIHDKIDFINLNELEIADSNANSVVEKGFEPKDRISYGIKGSQEFALELVKLCKELGLSAHYCTAMLKDSVQMGNRFKRRAKNISKAYDVVTEEGMIIRGVIYFEKPGVGYRKKLKTTDITKELEDKRKELMDSFEIPEEFIEVDTSKQRILTSPGIVEEFADKIKELNLIPAIVEEDPTYDALELSIDFL